jgi:gamma-glutamylcyclotransferase (GGCT)/AIG2-like uncharacterized protein YtfP
VEGRVSQPVSPQVSQPVTGPVHLFVYGTLRRGDRNDITRLEPAPTLLGFGTVRGRLFDFGNYPGIVLSEAGEQVLGEVYAAAPALIPVLDEIEMLYPDTPHLYRQAWREVYCGGLKLDCLLYELTDAGASAEREIKALPGALLDWTSYDLQRGQAA